MIADGHGTHASKPLRTGTLTYPPAMLRAKFLVITHEITPSQIRADLAMADANYEGHSIQTRPLPSWMSGGVRDLPQIPNLRHIPLTRRALRASTSPTREEVEDAAPLRTCDCPGFQGEAKWAAVLADNLADHAAPSRGWIGFTASTRAGPRTQLAQHEVGR